MIDVPWSGVPVVEVPAPHAPDRGSPLNAEAHRLASTHVVDAARGRVHRASTDPGDLTAWCGPAGDDGIEPFETRLRVEARDEADSRTRIGA